MSVSLTCKRCGETIIANNEDELVDRVQLHVGDHAREHGHRHIPSRKHILARLHRQEPNSDLPRPDRNP